MDKAVKAVKARPSVDLLAPLTPSFPSAASNPTRTTGGTDFGDLGSYEGSSTESNAARSNAARTSLGDLAPAAVRADPGLDTTDQMLDPPPAKDGTIDLQRHEDAVLLPSRSGIESTSGPGSDFWPETSPRRQHAPPVVRDTTIQQETPRRGPVLLLALGIVASLGVIAFLATRTSSPPNAEDVAVDADGSAELAELAESGVDPEADGAAAGEADTDGVDADGTIGDETVTGSETTVVSEPLAGVSFEVDSTEPETFASMVGSGESPVGFGEWGSVGDGNWTVRVAGLEATGLETDDAASLQPVTVGAVILRSGGTGADPAELTWRLLSPSNAIYDMAESNCGAAVPSPPSNAGLLASGSGYESVLCWQVKDADAVYEDLMLLVQAPGDEFPNVFSLSPS